MNRLLQLADIINSRLITVVHQPVVDLLTGETVGYEALARGPAGYFEMPARLFKHAADYDVLLDLDQLCLDMALSSLQPGLNFVNVIPDNVPRLRFSEDVAAVLRGRVVVEITERRINGCAGGIKEALDRWRESLAVRVAVDDVEQGALTNVGYLRPDFVKFSRTLVSGCDRSSANRVILKHLARMTTDMGIEAVAEGLERREEVKTVKDLGIRYGQGYLLGKPERKILQRR